MLCTFWQDVKTYYHYFTWVTVILSSTNNDFADPSSPKTLMNIFLIEASFIFSMANLIFSALAWEAGSSSLRPPLAKLLTNFKFRLFFKTFVVVVVDDDVIGFDVEEDDAAADELPPLINFCVLLLSLPELLDVLSQKAESLSGLSVLFCCWAPPPETRIKSY